VKGPSTWLAGALAASMAACGSSPPSAFFALSPMASDARSTVATPPPASAAPGLAVRTIRLRRPSIPSYLDRPEIVRRVVGYRLGVAANERWGGPLDEMIGRTLAQDIEERLPQSSVYVEDGAITADPDATIEVNVQRFEEGDGGDLTLVAEIAVERDGAHQASAARSVRLVAHPGASTSALVAAMSDLLGRLAQEIAALLARAPSP